MNARSLRIGAATAVGKNRRRVQEQEDDVAEAVPFATNVPKSSWTIFCDGSHLLAGRNVRRFRTSHKGYGLVASNVIVDYWQTLYDWRRCEAMLNAFGQYRTEIDGLNIHFLLFVPGMKVRYPCY